MKRFLAVFSTAVLAFSITACGEDDDSYRPAAFGENGQCYYVDDPEEATTLVKEGLCDQSWRPSPAPDYWLFMYMPYYTSPAYRDYYVPERHRARYNTKTSQFSSKYSKEIAAAQGKAKYSTKSGKTADGNKVPRGEFGGGVRGKKGSGTRACNFIVMSFVAPEGSGPSGGGGSRGGGGSGKSGSNGSGKSGSGKSGSNSGSTKNKC